MPSKLKIDMAKPIQYCFAPAMAESILKILTENLNTILLAVLIPFLLMTLFTLIRKGFGNSLTAMPDVLVCVASVDFYFALAPDVWKPMVHPSIKDSFPLVSFALGLIAAIFFLYSLSVERRLINCWIKQRLSGTLLPSSISATRFPYGGIVLSWFLIGTAIAINSLQFLARR